MVRHQRSRCQHLRQEEYAIEALEIGPRIAEARKRLEWSQAEVARRSGLSRAYVNALELGRGKRPGADVLRRLEDVLGPLSDRGEVSDGRAALPRGLAAIARERGIPASELRVLAGLRVRGAQPRSEQRWRFIYDALIASEGLEGARAQDGDEVGS